MSATANAARQGKDLLHATRPFAVDIPRRSRWLAITSFGALAVALAAAAWAPWTAVRLIAGTLAGLLVVRCFILYHDFMHGSILRKSRIAEVLLGCYGVLILNPPRAWRETHNYHHAHTAKLVGSHVGSFPLLTPRTWAALPLRQRLQYRIVRHPVTVMLGYASVFFYGMCLRAFLRSPRQHYDAGIALALHTMLTIGVLYAFGMSTYVLVICWPMLVACALGAYIFYAQHNFPGVRILARADWTYARAALESSAFLRMSPVMHWFTGNIGYHHVHHLNPAIPFYRLPEAMAAIPELQQPISVGIGLGDIVACFRLKLWDPASDRMVGFPAARR